MRVTCHSLKNWILQERYSPHLRLTPAPGELHLFSSELYWLFWGAWPNVQLPEGTNKPVPAGSPSEVGTMNQKKKSLRPRSLVAVQEAASRYQIFWIMKDQLRDHLTQQPQYTVLY